MNPIDCIHDEGNMSKTLDYLIVGAGFSGATCARALADAGKRCLVIDRRDHIGGNAYDRFDDHGVLIHEYGPHIFHTNSEKIFNWLSRFTEWRSYEHRVRAVVNGVEYPIPINRTTINKLYGLDLDEAGVAKFLDGVRTSCEKIATSEDAVLSAVGPELCDLFFRGYTKKQWGLDLSQLDASVASRIPTRTNDDDRYFTDRFQAMPKEGYTVMFERMLDHPLIDVRVGTAFDRHVDGSIERNATIYTGSIDEYFGYQYGALPYRSLRFEHLHLNGGLSQSVGTVNYPNDHEWTRVTEFRHLTGQEHEGTSVVREYPSAHGEPYYPIPNPETDELYGLYRSMAEGVRNVYFVGRMAQYRYYNMDQAVAAALKLAERLVSSCSRELGCE